MRLGFAALALAGVCAMATGAARADVVYTFTTTSQAYLGKSSYYMSGLPLYGTIDLPNATVSSGSFILDGRLNTPDMIAYFKQPIYQAQSGSFVSVNIDGVRATPTSLYGAIDLSLTFDKNGQITSSNFSGYSYTDDFNGSGPGYNVSGFVGSDDPRCNADASQNLCAYSGYFTETGFVPSPSPAPEPATFAILGTGLIGLAAARRRII